MTEQQLELDPAEHEDVMFVMQMLSDVFGGEPVIAVGVAEDTGNRVYGVMSSCDCGVCASFRKGFPQKFYESMVGAARAYAGNRSSFMLSQDLGETPRTCH